jgi:hypothetical protein
MALRARRRLLRCGDSKTVGLLDMIFPGEAWPPARKAKGGLLAEAMRPHCCPLRAPCCANAGHAPSSSTASVRRVRQRVTWKSRRSSSSCPDERLSWRRGVLPSNVVTFWCRGIPPSPAGLGLLDEPPESWPGFGDAALEAPTVDAPLRIDPGTSGNAGSDGSAGCFPTDARLHRVSWAWVLLGLHGSILAGA